MDKKKRFMALLLAAAMLIGMLPVSALANDSTAQTLQAVWATTISPDGVLSEAEWIATGSLSATAANAPGGSVSAAWDRENLYLGVASNEAASVTATVNEASATAALTEGTAELVLSWSQTGVALQDLYQKVSGLTVTLTGANGTTQETFDVVLTTLSVNDLNLSKMTQNGTAKTNLTSVTADAVSWNASSTGIAEIYLANQALVDHTRDMLLVQTVKIDALPVSTGHVAGGGTAGNDYYYFWISDVDDSQDDKEANNSGSAFWCSIYRINEEGELYLRVHNDYRYTDKTQDNPGVSLGKKLGESFQLAALWRADGTAVIYVDGKVQQEVENATITNNSGFGNKCYRFSHKNGAGQTAKLTVSDAVLSVSSKSSIAEEVTAEAVLGGMDLSNVTGDLTLPGVFVTESLGQIALTWKSADETVLSNDGKVTRPQGVENKVVELSAYSGSTLLFTVEVSIAPGPSDDKLLMFPTDGVTLDGELSEKSYVLLRKLSGAEGCPSGELYAAYNKTGVYIGITYTGATSAKLNLNGKLLSVDLTDGTVEGTGSAAVTAEGGSAELLLTWEQLGMTLSDYYQEIYGGQLALTNAAGSTALAELSFDLVASSLKINAVDFSKMSTNFNPKTDTTLQSSMTVTANSVTWDASAKGTAQVYTTGQALVDHSKDILLMQTLKIDSLSKATGQAIGDSTAGHHCYYFWICDVVDDKDDGTVNNSGSAFWCAVYRNKDTNTLTLHIYNNNRGTDKPNGFTAISLGKKVGETFQLSTLWRADDSAVIYVDGQVVGEVENATITNTSGLGAKCYRFGYQHYATTASPSTAKLSVSDTFLNVAPVKSVREEMTVSKLLPNVDLTAVSEDLELPATYESDYLGSIPLTWESSDPYVINAETGAVTCPDSDSGEVVQLSVYTGGKLVWTEDVTVKAAKETVEGPVPDSPGIITAAFTSDAVSVDGKPEEAGWVLGTRVLDDQKMVTGKFGVQWDMENLYLVIKARGVNAVTLTVNGKTAVLATDTLTLSGEFTAAQVAKYQSYYELTVPLSQLGIIVTGYDTLTDIAVDMDGSSYAGQLRLAGVDWFVADNEFRSLPVSVIGTVKYKGGAPVEGCQGYEQVPDGWRMYDLYNADGENPAGVRTYVIMMKDEIFDPMADRSATIFVEFDFKAKAMPVYTVAEDAGWDAYYASYGFTWFYADDDDASKNANNISMGIVNTENGLVMVALRGDGSVWQRPLNKKVGDLFRIGTAWKTNGDLIVYINGETFATITALECVRNSYGDKSIGFNLIRNQNAAASAADDLDVTVTNISAGHAQENTLVDQLTWDTIRGDNTDPMNLTAKLSLPNTLSDAQLGTSATVTWSSSDTSVLTNEGKVTQPAADAVEVTLTAALSDGTQKTFRLRVVGISNSSGNVLVLSADYTPATGAGMTLDAYEYTLDTGNRSVIIDLQAKKSVNLVTLTDGDSFARLNEEVLTLWVSDDNVSYTRIKDFKLKHNGANWYLYDFTAEGRYVKVHCTHFDGAEADFTGPVAQMITACYDASLAAAGEKTVAVPTTTLKDQAVQLALPEGIQKECLRVSLNDKLLYHYFDESGNVFVRIPEPGTKGDLAVWNGAVGSIELSNKEHVYEITYGTREVKGIKGEARWLLTLTDGTLLTLGEGGGGIWRAFSEDDGVTWTQKEVIACSKGFISEGGGFIYDTHTGRIMFQGHSSGTFVSSDMTQSSMQTNIIYSDDGGMTWEQIGTVKTDSTYALSYTDGTMLSCYDGAGSNVDFVFPIGCQYNNNGSFCCRVAYTIDGGLTWQTGDDQIIYEEGASFEGGVSECTIQEREDGVLVLLGRNQGLGIDNFAQAYSYDHGITWTNPAKLSSVYTTNTQPIMFCYEDAILLTWGGNNMLGGESRIRAPYSIAVTYDGMENFRNIQDLYVKYSLQGLTHSTQNRITNQSVQVTDEDTLLTIWWNQTKGGTVKDTLLMRVEDFNDYFYRTKGAYDSFEHGTTRYEGWETTGGDVTLSDTYASDGSYSMLVSSGTVTRSVPYIQDGTVSMDIYVEDAQSFSIDLQSAYTNVSGKGAPVGINVVDNAVTVMGETAATGLSLRSGEWNTLTFELKLTEGKALFSLNGSDFVDMKVNSAIGDYVSFLTLFSAGEIWVDDVLVIDAQDAAIPEKKEPAPEISFNSVSLKGNIGVNYYMTLPESVLADENAYMEFAVEGKEPVKVPVADAIEETVEGKTYYVFTCEVPAKEMNDIITAQFFYGDGESTEAKQYSVAAYAYEILEDTTGAYDEVKPLVEAMLNYGAAAQAHFDYNTDDPANADLEKKPDYSGITAETLAPYVGTGSGSADAPFYGSSLLLKGETSLRFFFEVAEGAEFTATCAGEAMDTNIRGGLHYVTVENISAKDLDERITVVANGSEVTASALTYAYNVLSANEGTYSNELITLVKALYAYNQAANAYFEN